MRYLFFDIECCDGEHICEFGYIVTDTAFRVIERDIFLINPEKPFALDGRGNRRDLKLWYTNEEYEMSPTFPAYHSVIKSLIEAPDQIVIGHAIENDAAFLRTACRRYQCEPINFRFCDSQKMYSEFANIHRQVSLADAVDALDTQKPDYLHRSDVDAHATMTLVKAMCRSLEVSLSEYIELSPTVMGRMEDHRIYHEGEHEKWEGLLAAMMDKTLDPDGQKLLFRRVVTHVEPRPDSENYLFGDKYCMDERFEEEHPLLAMRLIQLITDCGGLYLTAARKCFVFIAASEDAASTLRYAAVHDGSKKTRRIKTVTLDELLKKLGFTRSALEAYPIPTADMLSEDERTQKEKRIAHSKRFVNIGAGNASPTTIGDSLKAQGIDLAKLFGNG